MDLLPVNFVHFWPAMLDLNFVTHCLLSVSNIFCFCNLHTSGHWWIFAITCTKQIYGVRKVIQEMHFAAWIIWFLFSNTSRGASTTACGRAQIWAMKRHNYFFSLQKLCLLAHYLPCIKTSQSKCYKQSDTNIHLSF